MSIKQATDEIPDELKLPFERPFGEAIRIYLGRLKKLALVWMTAIVFIFFVFLGSKFFGLPTKVTSIELPLPSDVVLPLLVFCAFLLLAIIKMNLLQEKFVKKVTNDSYIKQYLLFKQFLIESMHESLMEDLHAKERDPHLHKLKKEMFAIFCKWARYTQKYTKEQMAKKLDIEAEMYQLYENGEIEPTEEVIKKLHLSEEEIYLSKTENLSVSVGTVKSRLTKVKKRLEILLSISEKK